MLAVRRIGVLLIALWATTAWSVAEVTQEIAQILQEERLTGAVWMWIDGGRSGSGSAGYRDNETQDHLSIDHRVHVGSVTKMVVATGVLRMVSQGLLDLDSPVEDLVPEVRFDNPWRDQSRVTVRHLLDHTAGLDDARLWQMFSLRPNPDTPLLDAFPDRALGLPVRARPGTRFAYSNSGYGLLGLVIESITNRRYEDYLDQELLAPLGLSESTFHYTTQEGEAADPTLAWGHIDDGSRYPAAPIFLRPAGQFTTTAGDLVALARFLMSDGQLNGEVFIREDLMRARGRPVGTEAADHGLIAGYALGLARRDRYGAVGYCHLGNIVGFVAVFCLYPEEDKAFAYSVNTDSETANYQRIAQALAESLSLRAPTEPAVKPVDLEEWKGWYIPSPNRFQTFVYLDQIFAATRVRGENGQLLLEPLAGRSRRLQPLGDGLFSAQDRATASHVFYRDGQGQRAFSDGFSNSQEIHPVVPLALGGSLFLGLAGLSWLALAGLWVVVRDRRQCLQHPLAPVIGGFLVLLLAVPFLIGQSFMALGDVTVGNVLLAAATGALPLLCGWSIWRLGWTNNWDRVHSVAAAAVIQWCAVLAAFGLLPFRLWN